MSLICSTIPVRVLNTDYIAAKIIASPYDYKLTDRLIFQSDINCRDKYNLFTKSACTEMMLAEALGLNMGHYLYENVSPIVNKNCDSYLLSKLYWQYGGLGTMIRYNNLIINETTLCGDMLNQKLVISDLKDKNYLKALEVWFLMSTNSSSIIPNLFYLMTNKKDLRLQDLENITFAEEAINNGDAPIVIPGNESDDDDEITEDSVLATSVIHSPMLPVPEISKLDPVFLKLGLVQTIVYGTELLYQFSKITDPDIKLALEDLLSMQYAPSNFCAKYLYSFDSTGYLVINPRIEYCFSDDNETRFRNIRLLLEEFETNVDFSKDILASGFYFYTPIFLLRMVTNMHAYAYQICRIKHLILLYKTAKNRGLLNKDTFKMTIDESMMNSGLLDSDTGDTVSDELLNLVSVDYNTDVIADDAIKNKSKKEGPTLNTADALKQELNDSVYEFDVQEVPKMTDGTSYNHIAKNILLITKNLSKQIKEIKVYNTGGKNSGLSIGKLDKKNLWKYKTDKHIFYNNTYKLKEMDLAFGCILDQSGSMSGEGIQNGQIVMVLLHEVLNSLGINHSIIGHSSNHQHQSTIYKYYNFKEDENYSLAKPYNIITAKARNGNCDSGALYYMQKAMKRVQNKDKIVLIFSDGEPTECSDLDLTNQVKAMEKEGIHVIGIGINFDSIVDYYPDNANGRNLKEMIDIVVNILKRYVIEKKED